MPATLTFKINDIGFFDELVSMLSNLISVSSIIDLYSNGYPTDYYRSDNYKATIHGRFVDFRWHSQMLLNSISANDWPNIIGLFLSTPSNTQHVSNSVNLNHHGIQNLIYSIVEAHFLSFYSKYEDRIKESFGQHTNDWPMIWNFCRVIRNAFAHGRCIHIANPNAISVTWKGCSICYSNNGDNIFNFQSYIGPADIILLMIEADESFT